MKQIYLTTLLILSSFAMVAQFPGKNVSVLNNAEVIVKELPEDRRQDGYSHFYTKETMRYNEIYAPQKGFTSAYDSLVGKVFKVIEVIPYKDPSNNEFYKLKLENPQTGIIYFEYNMSEFDYPFKFTNAAILPKDFYCQEFDKQTEDGVTSVASPYEDGIYFVKYIEKKSTEYYMEANVDAKTLRNAPKGLTVTLENGKSINYPAANVKIDVENGMYRYIAFVRVNEAGIKLLLVNKIKTVEVDVFEANVREAAKLQEYIKCLRNIK